ncbi:hypothetical protein [Paenibacillus xylanexedens]|uniref:hypothetical protein n=1 Tax=Paenibacillus xylanexedens TaxID=528191 RepID=UPI001C92C4A0|nr:hypothetical protein [Paenibacillus xylanexedens]
MMKKTLFSLLLVIFIAGCGKNNVERATEHLLRTQQSENEISVVMFGERDWEEDYVRELQAGLDELNNSVRQENPITNVTLVNVNDDRNYNYEKIFKLKSYPRILVFQHNKVIMKSSEPQDIIDFLENKED